MHPPTFDSPSRKAGDRRVADLAATPVWPVVALGSAITVICTLIVLATGFVLTSGDGPRALVNDFRVFWAAGQLALSGDFLGPFDTDKLTAVHNVSPEHWTPWLYPPGFLFLLAPFGALSYATGFAILSLLSCLCIGLAIRPFTAGSRTAWLAFGLAPAYLPILLQGQNGLIWLAGLVAALAALRDERWVLAGVFIGLLTLKPQFGLLIPVALIAAGLWRTTIVASLTAVVVAALPTLATGTEYWVLFFKRLREYGQRVVELVGSQDLLASPFAFFFRLGIPPEVALLLQAGLTLGAALCVLVVWRAGHASFDLKAATLLAGTLLASPYAWHYEAAILAPVGLFLLRAGVLQPKPLHLVLLATLWLGAGLQAMAIFVGFGEVHFRWAFVVTPVTILCLGLCLAHLRSTDRPSVATA
jgi:hypothetical protein